MCGETLTVKKEAAEGLRCAAKLLAEKGWIQRAYFNKDGSCCAIGALKRCIRPELNGMSTPCGEGYSEAYYAPVGILAADTLSKVVDTPHVPTWNDAPGRTKEEVIEALNKAADKLDPPPPPKPTKLDAAGLLREAINYIKLHGWTQGVFENRVGAVCCWGAITRVNSQALKDGLEPDYTRAVECMISVVTDETGVVGGHIPAWNDAPNMTKEHVLHGMEQAARKCEGLPTVAWQAPASAPVSEPELAPEPPVILCSTPIEAPPVLLANQNIKPRRELKPGTVFVYLELPPHCATVYGGLQRVGDHPEAIGNIRVVAGANPSYLFRDTKAHKARFKKADLSNPTDPVILDCRCLVLEEV